MKSALLHIHNELRNEIAMGRIDNYGPAANMMTMEWDDDLEANAAINVQHCNEWVHDSYGTGNY